MGNLLPCCNPEERAKDSALLIPNPNGGSHNTSHSQTHPLLSSSSDGGLGHRGNNGSNSHGALSSANKKSSSSSSPQPPGASASGNGADPSDPGSLLQLEERQRAMHQEQERLERIVNDAGRDMVNVNGGGAGGLAAHHHAKKSGAGGGAGVGVGGANGMMMHMNGYYDAGYASEMWHCLIPSRTSNGSPGGLIPKCEGIMKEQQEEKEKEAEAEAKKGDIPSTGSRSGGKHLNNRLLDLRKMPNTCIVEVRAPREGDTSNNINNGRNEDDDEVVWDVLSQGLLDNPSAWNEGVVRALERVILDADGCGCGYGLSSSSSTNNNSNINMGKDGMEMVLDDLAERFLAGVFREGGSLRTGAGGGGGVGVAPIVENVL